MLKGVILSVHNTSEISPKEGREGANMQVLLQPTTAATTRSMVMAANTAFTSVVMHTGCCSFKARANNPLLGTFVSFSRLQSRGAKLCTRGPILCEAGAVLTTSIPGERFRLNNLRPQPGSRKKNKRKGRGDSAGQGGSCGFGMKGQKSRAGSGVRRGFEGGQMPLYRRLPKLKGIAGGMRAGQPKYIPINLDFIEAAGYEENEEVSFETLKSKRLINPSGRERKLPIKILGDGVLTKKLTIKARAYSSSAKEKLESAGCTLITLPGRKKWMKPSVLRNIERAKEYFKKKEAAKST